MKYSLIPCAHRSVANKPINGKQCTIVFYANTNKISHEDTKVFTGVIESISNHFGKLIVPRSNKHDFLGTNIDIRVTKVFVEIKIMS